MELSGWNPMRNGTAASKSMGDVRVVMREAWLHRADWKVLGKYSVDN
jgi:hypothetical protein